MSFLTVRSCFRDFIRLATSVLIANEIESELFNNLINEVTTSQIGEMAMEKLKGLDDVAYVRFASVYREFKDINTFLDELKSLKKKTKKKKTDE